MEPLVAIEPRAWPAISDAVEQGGGTVAGSHRANAVVWTDPSDAAGLKALLSTASPAWVQLPFAGIEKFFESGIIDAGRTWTCAKGIYGRTTAELALTLICCAARLIPRHVRERGWHPRFDAAEHRLIGGTTALLIGTGGIGTALLKMLRPLGVRILAVNRSGAPLEGAERTETSEAIPSLVGEADWIVLSAALTPSTAGLIGAATLAKMRRDAWLINVGRGGLVDTVALVDALRAGGVGGAALDVTDPEPLPDDHPLWDFPNVIITSHTANTFEMAVPELSALVTRNVGHFARGEQLEGLVDPALGY
ncbi:MAG: D-isomer specific 2-hydroxyacid dehydrogenase family protein [Actinomycetota bacterium]|nr:D-isomer specific 2-hydroxyacid dehydrogenase family protein [Actinomycetota bacterium]